MNSELIEQLKRIADALELISENTKPKTRKSRYDWSEVEWSMEDKDIAKEIGCSVSAVAYQRSKIKNNNQPKSDVAKFPKYSKYSKMTGGCQ